MPVTFQPDILRGKVALVTGGGTGLGFGIASAFARHGAAVAIASRKRAHLDPAVERLRAFGATAIAEEANVRDVDSVRAMVQRVADSLGGLDILINNAAGNFYAPAATLTPNGWRAVVETDLYGAFFCAQAAYPALRARGGGRIISISMTLHYRGWPFMAHATAAKAGVDALTRTLALEWARDGITVNAIAPGPIPTEGASRAFQPPEGTGADAAPPLDQDLAQRIPLGRVGTPEDVANMALYLASPAASWITGAIFVVDGGAWLSR